MTTPAIIDGETVPVQSEDAVPEFDAVDALTRVLVGGTAELSDLLLQQLAHWESNVAARQTTTLIEEEEDVGDVVRFLLVGLIFESQHQVRRSIGTAGSLMLSAVNTTGAVAGTITRSRLFSPARRGARAASGRLESEIARLVRVGRTEEFVGRLMAEEAVQETVVLVMDYIAHDPEIRRLVQQQAVGFGGEVTIGARERMITGDNILEGFFRRLFGRKPRADLPGPPTEVVRQAKLMAQEGQGVEP